MIDFKNLRRLAGGNDLRELMCYIDSMEKQYLRDRIESEYKYESNSLITNTGFIESHELVSAGYLAKPFTPLVKEFGYDLVNSVLVSMVLSDVKEEENDD